MRRERPNQHDLRRRLVGDSIERERWMKQLLDLVREDERTKVLATLNRAREQAETERR